MMASSTKLMAKGNPEVSVSDKSVSDSTASHPNSTVNARTRLQEKEQLGGLNDRLAVYMERVRSLESENARLHIQVRESEAVEKSSIRGLEQQYESRISQLRNQFEVIGREKAKLEMDQRRAVDTGKDLRSAAEQLRMEVKLAESQIADSYTRVQELKSSLADREGRFLIAEKEKKALKEEEVGCKKEIDSIRNQLDNEVLLRKDLQNKLATYKDDVEFTRRNSNKTIEEFRSKRQFEMSVFSNEVENRYQAKLQDQLQTMRADFDQRITETRAEMDTRYQGKLTKAKEDNDRSRQSAVKGRQEAACYRLKMEELEKSLAGNNIDVDALKAKIAELDSHLRCLHESNENCLHERDESILALENRLNAMMEEYRSLMDVKVQMDTELLAYQKLLEGEENRLNINVNGSLSSQPLCSTPQEDSIPGVIQPTLRRHAKRRRFNDSFEVSQILKTYNTPGGSLGDLVVDEVATDGSFICIRNKGNTACSIGGWKLTSTAGLKEVSYRFSSKQIIGPKESLAIWSSGSQPADKLKSHLVMRTQSWPVDDAIKSVLINAAGVMEAWRESILQHRVEESEVVV